MAKRLTALQIENAKPGKARREISDGGSGLYLVVQPSGHKSYAVRFRADGVPRKYTLAAGLTLHEAREQAAAVIKEAQRGNDPTKIKRAAKQARVLAAANTFEATAQLYLNSDKVKKLRTCHQYRGMLERLAFPLIGDKPIADIRRSQITALLDHVEHSHGPVMADRLLSVVSCVLKFHAKRSDDYVLPLVPGMNRTSTKERARDRILTDDEIRRVWNTGNAFVRFLLLCGCRRTEAAAMQHSELNGNDWVLPASRNKGGIDLVRPLSKAAMAVLQAQPRHSDFVFSNRDDRPFQSYTRLKAQVDAASGVTGWRLHDLRRTARSLLSRAGVNSDVAEMILGHTLKGVRGTYDRHSYHNEKAHALEALAAQLALITNPPKGNVRQLRRA
ncbi:MAG: integrase arm-type DNA-binding domain-containing protein [Xanthobacteraceae bacterium]